MTRIDTIAQFFRDRVGVEVTTLEIDRATGTCAASTKISQLKARGMYIRKTRDEWRKDGTRVCGYTYFPDRLPRTCGEATGHDAGSQTASPHKSAIVSTAPISELLSKQTRPATESSRIRTSIDVAKPGNGSTPLSPQPLGASGDSRERPALFDLFPQSDADRMPI